MDWSGTWRRVRHEEEAVVGQFPISASIRRYALVAEIGTAILHVIDIAITTIHH